jgi:uncharacterized protein YigE (DUF2233 family)
VPAAGNVLSSLRTRPFTPRMHTSARILAVLFLSLATAVAASPAGIEFRQVRLGSGFGASTLYHVRFDPKTHAFAVMDNPGGDFSLATAAQKRGALAAVNGGYFHPDRRPLGLVVRQGVKLHAQERAPLLSGLVVATRKGVALPRAQGFKLTPDVREALQAGPFLIENGQPVAGLNATRSAARTVVVADAAGRFGFVVCRSATLAGMAATLATAEHFPGGKITRALNLDGGSSTGLWVRGERPFYLREFKDVRNYLAIVVR